MKHLVLTSLVIFGFTGMAQAQAPTEVQSQIKTQCPLPAIQTLYDLKLKVYAGAEQNVQTIFGWANEAMKVCADNDAAMGLAAELYLLVAANIPKPNDKFTVYSQAYQAVLNNGSAYVQGSAAPIVKEPDGSERTLNVYAQTNTVLGSIITGLADLSLSGYTHEIFSQSYESHMSCPHISEGRVDKEAEALNLWSDQNYGKRQKALWRLEGLWTACPKLRTKTLSYHLAHMYLLQAEFFEKTRKNPDVGLGFAEKSQIYAAENQNLPDEKFVFNRWTQTNNGNLKDTIRNLNKQKQKGIK